MLSTWNELIVIVINIVEYSNTQHDIISMISLKVIL